MPSLAVSAATTSSARVAGPPAAVALLALPFAAQLAGLLGAAPGAAAGVAVTSHRGTPPASAQLSAAQRMVDAQSAAGEACGVVAATPSAHKATPISAGASEGAGRPAERGTAARRSPMVAPVDGSAPAVSDPSGPAGAALAGALVPLVVVAGVAPERTGATGFRSSALVSTATWAANSPATGQAASSADMLAPVAASDRQATPFAAAGGVPAGGQNVPSPATGSDAADAPLYGQIAGAVQMISVWYRCRRRRIGSCFGGFYRQRNPAWQTGGWAWHDVSCDFAGCNPVFRGPPCGGTAYAGPACGGPASDDPACDGPTCDGPTCAGPACAGPACAGPAC